MAFVELDECISIFSLSLFYFFVRFHVQNVIWISSPELSYVCHIYAMSICAPVWAENT